MTGWFEILEYGDKKEDIIDNLVYKMRLCRYPMPTTIMYYRSN